MKNLFRFVSPKTSLFIFTLFFITLTITLSTDSFAQIDTTPPSISLPNATISTIAGSSQGDAVGDAINSALFYQPASIALGPNNVIYIADTRNHKIKTLINDTVYEFVGSTLGNSDGNGTSAAFDRPSDIAFVANGSFFYVADSYNSLIKKVTIDGAVTTFAGTGSRAYTDGNGTSAAFDRPYGIAVDENDTLYVSDSGNHVIRKITLDGNVTTFAGTGASGATNGDRLSATFDDPRKLAFDSMNNLYIGDDDDDLVRKIFTNGTVVTFAGIDGAGGTDDGPRLSAKFNGVRGLVIDPFDNIYVADYNNNRIRVISNDIVSTLAGSSSGSADGPASNATFNRPQSIVVDSNVLYIADSFNHKIRKAILDSSVILNLNTGVFSIKFTEEVDNVVLSRFTIRNPNITLDGASSQSTNTTLYIILTESQKISLLNKTALTLDLSANAVQDTTGNQITATSSTAINTIPDITPPNFVNATYSASTGVLILTFDETIATSEINSSAITISTSGTTFTLAGSSVSPDAKIIHLTLSSIPATTPGNYTIIFAQNSISDLSLNYISAQNHSLNIVIEATPPNITSVVIDQGTGILNITFSEIVALDSIDKNKIFISQINTNNQISLDDSRLITRTNSDVLSFILSESQRQSVINLSTPQLDVAQGAVADLRSNEIIQSLNINTSVILDDVKPSLSTTSVTTDSLVSTIAGSATANSTDGSALDARFSFPRGIIFDSTGNLYIADQNSYKIRILYINGTVDTLAGNGSASSIDGSALNATFNQPSALALDTSGNLYIADRLGHKIRVLYTNGTVGTIAGSGTQGDTDGLGLSATFNRPRGLAFDSIGNLYIADSDNHKIRILYPNGTVDTIAGTGSRGNVDDSALSSSFAYPVGLVLDSADNLYIADFSNEKIRVLYTNGTVSTVAGNGSTGSVDGLASSATFNKPNDITFDSSGNLYIADFANNKIRVLYTNGTVDTLAGNGLSGSTDGLVLNASFTRLISVASDSSENLYVSDLNSIRKISTISPITLNKDTGSLVVLFSEIVDISSIDLSSMSLSTNISTVQLTSSTLSNTVNDSEITITLTESQRQSILVDTPRFISTINTVRDTSGNGIDPINSSVNIIPDTTSPSIINTDYSTSSGILTLSFTETIDTSEINYSRISISKDGTQLFTLASYVVSVDSKIINISLTTTDQQLITSGNFTIIFKDNSISDRAGNFISAQTRTLNVLFETIPPTISSVSLNEGTGILNITFSEIILVSSINSSRIYISESNSNNQISLYGSTLTSTDSSVLSFNLSETQRQSVIALGTPQLDITQGAVADLRSNEIIQSLDNSINTTPDTIKPTLPKSEIDTNSIVSTIAGSTASGSTDGSAQSARFNVPFGIAFDSADNLYIADFSNNKIRVLYQNGTVSTLAGTGSTGSADGPALNATFNQLSGLAFDSTGNLYIADSSNYKIRVLYQNGTVSTLAGTGSTGSADGPALNATFNQLSGLAFDSTGNLYIADVSNHKIRVLYQNGTVSTLAGTGFIGSADGSALNATFNRPSAIVFDSTGNLYIADRSNFKIRVLYQNGTVSTLAGTGSFGDTDGSALNAQFTQIYDIAFDSTGNLYIADSSNFKIRVLYQNGTVSTLAGTGSQGSVDGSASSATFNTPYGLAFDSIGNLYTSTFHSIRKISTIPPVILNSGLGTLTIQFSETIDISSIDLSKITLSGTNSVSLASSTLNNVVNNSVITITLTESQRQSIILDTPQLVTVVGAFSDTSGNSLNAVNSNIHIIPDTTSPSVTNATLNLGNGIMVLTFDEIINLPIDTSKLNFNNQVSLTGSSTTTNSNSNIITIQLTESQRQSVIVISSPQLNIQVGFANDTSDNTIQSSIITPVIQVDIIPPTFVNASINKSTGILSITFNENIGAINKSQIFLSTQNVQNQYSLENSISTISDSTITLVLSESIRQTSISDTLQLDLLLGAVSDVSSVDILAVSDRIILQINDVVSPVFNSGSINASDGVIILQFNEYVQSLDLTKITIVSILSSDTSIVGAQGVISVSNLTITLTESQRQSLLDHGSSPKLTISNGAISDTTGNLISTINASLQYHSDVIKPTLTSVTLDRDSRNLTITFSESIVNPSASNFYIKESNSTNRSQLSSSIVTTNNAILILTIPQSIIDLLISSASLQLDLTSAAVTDRSGNAIPSVANTDVVLINDDLAPNFSSATFNEGNGMLTLTFTKIINTTVSTPFDTTKLTLHDQSSSGLALGTLTFIINNQNILIQFDETQRQTLIALGQLELDLAVNAIADRNGTPNNLSTSNYVVTIIPDTTSPSVTNATLNLGNGIMVLTFDEIINLPIDTSKLNFNNQVSLTGSSTTTNSNSNIITIQLTESQRQSVIVISSPQLNIQVGFANDTSDNTIQSSIITPVIQVDIIPPTFVNASINKSTGILSITFNENIGAINKSQIFLSTQNVQNQYSLENSTSTISDSTITLVLSESIRQTSISDTLQLDLLLGAVSDVSSVDILAVSDRIILQINDVVSPVFNSGSINASDGVIILQFNEYVQSLDLTKITIVSILSSNTSIVGAQGVISVSTLTITLTESQRQSLLDHGSSPKLTISNGAISDTTGNLISTINASLQYHSDIIKPTLTSVTLDRDSRNLTITFSESIVNPSASNFYIKESNSINRSQLSSSIVTTNNAILILTIPQSIIDLLISSASLQLDLTSAAVTDRSGNAIPSVANTDVVLINDDLAPNFSSATFNEGNGMLTLTFTKIINTTVSTPFDTTKLTLHDQSSSGLALGTLTFIINNQNILIQFDETQRQTLIALGQLELDLAVNAIADRNGTPNNLSTSNYVVTIIPDTTSPSVTNAVYSTSTGILTLSFDETIDTSEINYSRISVSRDGTSLFTLASYNITSDSVILQFTLNNNHQQLITTGNYSLVFASDSIPDSTGNFISAQTRTLNVLFETIPPTISSVSLNEGTGILNITLSEIILVSSINSSRIYISESNSNNQISLGDFILTTSTDSDVLSFNLSESQRQSVIALGTPQLDVAYGAVADLRSNEIIQSLDNSINTTPDTIKPTLPKSEIGTNFIVSTIAGSTASGSTDGSVQSARFNTPSGLAFDSTGNLYIADTFNNKIRVLYQNGTVSTLAGTGSTGSADGQALNATFNEPADLAFDSIGNLYIADKASNKIRVLYTNGTVSTVLSNIPSTSIAFDSNDDLYIGIASNVYLTVLHENGTSSTLFDNGFGSTDGNINTATITNIIALEFDSVGNLYFSDASKIRVLYKNDTVTTLAGTGVQGSADGPALNATFYQPPDLTFDSVGNLYIADQASNKIRVLYTNGTVSTLAGTGSSGSTDGSALSATFNTPYGLAFDSIGNLYTSTLHSIRKISTIQPVILNSGLGTLTIQFSETIDISSIDLSKITLSGTNSVSLASSTLNNVVNNSVITITLTESQRQSIILDTPRLVTVVGAFFDTSGNSLNAVNTSIIIIPDSRSPSLVNSSYSTITSMLELSFDETIDTSEINYSRISISRDGTTLFTLASYNITTDSEILQFTLNNNHQQLITTGNYSLVFASDSIPDSTGNFISAQTRTLNVLFETIPPTISSVSLNEGTGILNITFSEIILVSSINSSRIYISESNSNNQLSLDDFILTTSTDSDVLSFNLSESQRQSVIALGTPQLDVAYGAVADLRSNEIIQSLDNSINTTPDTIKPTLPKSEIDTNSIVSTIAGSTASGSTDGSAQSARFNTPSGLAFDSTGNLYIADGVNHKIRVLYQNGTVSTLAGTGSTGSADGPALNATFNSPSGLAFDSTGNLYIADTFNNKIRVLYQNGTVSTLAGTGSTGSADGQALNATFNSPSGLTFDSTDNLYIADGANHKIRVLYQNGTVSTLAGTGSSGSTDSSALSATFNRPSAIVFDPTGNLYIADSSNFKIRVLYQNGTVSTLAGTGSFGDTDGSALNAQFSQIYGITFDSTGNLYIADRSNHKIRVLYQNGTVSTLAGTGSSGSTDGSALSATFNFPNDLTFDSIGNLYTSTFHSIRKISPIPLVLLNSGLGTLTIQFSETIDISSIDLSKITLSGTNSVSLASSTLNNVVNNSVITITLTESQRQSIILDTPRLVTVVGAFFDTSGNSLNAVNTSIIIIPDSRSPSLVNSSYSTITGMLELSFDETIDTSEINYSRISISRDGTTLFTLASYNITTDSEILQFTLNNNHQQLITTGNYSLVFASDSIPDSTGNFISAQTRTLNVLFETIPPTISSVSLNEGTGILNITFSESILVSSINSSGLYISEINSNNQISLSDFTLVTSTNSDVLSFILSEFQRQSVINLSTPQLDVAQGAVADLRSNEIIQSLNIATNTILDTIKPSLSTTSVTTDSLVSTIAGSATANITDGSALDARFNFPRGIIFDSTGNLYIADQNSHNIRILYINGTVDTLAGNGSASSIDGSALNATFNQPSALALDTSGNLYIADRLGHKIRVLYTNGTVGTIAGSGTQGDTDGLGLSATFNRPRGLAFDSIGNLYIADSDNHKIRILYPNGTVDTIAGTGSRGNVDDSALSSSFAYPVGLVLDSADNLYVADFSNEKIRVLYTNGTVSTIAGNGSTGSVDGLASSATFNKPNDITFDSSGNLYIADFTNNKIRVLYTNGTVSTLSGNGLQGNLDGSALDATFTNAISLAFDSSENLYVSTLHSIRKISVASPITLNKDIGSLVVLFSETIDVSEIDLSRIHLSGTNFIPLTGSIKNNTVDNSAIIFTLTESQRQTILADTPRFVTSIGAFVDTSGNNLDPINSSIIIIPDVTSPNFVSAVYSIDTSILTLSFDETIDTSAINYSSISLNISGTILSLVGSSVTLDSEIIHITPNISQSIPPGNYTITLSSNSISDSAQNFVFAQSYPLSVVIESIPPNISFVSFDEGTGVLNITFSEIIPLTSINKNKIYISENNSSNQISLNDSTLVTSTNSDVLSFNLSESQRQNVIALGTPQLDIIQGAVFDTAGNSIASSLNNQINIILDNIPPSIILTSSGGMITPNSIVSIAAGINTVGNTDGPALSASFTDIRHIAFDSIGNLYITDYDNHNIRILYPNGTVSTVTGNGSSGSQDGLASNATFNATLGLAFDSTDNLYITDSKNHKIRILYTNGTVSTIAGNGTFGSTDGPALNSTFNNPAGLKFDSIGNLYIADSSNKIRILYTNGTVSTIAGSSRGDQDGPALSSQFRNPNSFEFDSIGNLYISDRGNNKIRILYTNNTVDTIAGTGSTGSTDGLALAASFNNPGSIIFDSFGNLYIADRFNEKIRVLYTNGTVSTITGAGNARVGIASSVSFVTPSGLAFDSIGNLYATSAYDIKKISVTLSPLSIVLDKGTGSITIPFSETIDISRIDTSRISLTGNNQTISLTGSILSNTVNSSEITILLTESQRQNVIPRYISKIVSQQNTFFDTSSNSLESFSVDIITVSDTISPLVSSGNLDKGLGILTINFSETVDINQNNVNLSSFYLQSGSTSISLSGAIISTSQNSTILSITLTQAQKDSVLPLSQISLNISTNAIYDVSNNGILLSTSQLNLEFTTIITSQNTMINLTSSSRYIIQNASDYSGSILNFTTSIINSTSTSFGQGFEDTSSNVKLLVQNSTRVNHDGSWNSLFLIQSNDSINVSQSHTLQLSITIGSKLDLTFTQPVQIVFLGQANKNYIAYYENSTHTVQFNQTCTNDINMSLANSESGSCTITNNNDVIIWTNHATTYGLASINPIITTPTPQPTAPVVLATPSVSSSSGSGGGGGRIYSSSSSIQTMSQPLIYKLSWDVVDDQKMITIIIGPKSENAFVTVRSSLSGIVSVVQSSDILYSNAIAYLAVLDDSEKFVTIKAGITDNNRVITVQKVADISKTVGQIIYDSSLSTEKTIVSKDDVKTENEDTIKEIDDKMTESKDMMGEDKMTESKDMMGEDKMTESKDMMGEDKMTESKDMMGEDKMTESKDMMEEDKMTESKDMMEEDKITTEKDIDLESNNGGCLIATAAYGTEFSQQIQLLREIRDSSLLTTSSGISFMGTFNQVYYTFSPFIADVERENLLFRSTIQTLLYPLISSLSIMTLADSESEVIGLGLFVIGINLILYLVLPTFIIIKIRKNYSDIRLFKNNVE